MLKILAIARNTFKEAVRNRILYILLIFALLIMASSGVISDLTIAAKDKMIKDLGLASINFFGLLIAVFVGIGLVYNEMDKKTIYTIISKPIDRYQFILGKYGGLLLTIYVMVLIMTAFFLFVIYFQQLVGTDTVAAAIGKIDEQGIYHSPTFGHYVLYLIQSFFVATGRTMGTLLQLYHSPLTANILAVVGYSCLELAIITAFAILYSTVSSPTLSAIFTVLTFIIGRMSEDIIRYAWRLKEKGLTVALSGKLKYWFVVAAAHVSPNLELFNKRSEAIYKEEVPWDGLAVYYGIMYSGMIILLAIIVFRRRNFK